MQVISFMPNELANTKKINSKLVFEALKASSAFAARLPDTSFPGMKPWLLNIINGLTGGELQSLLQRLEVYCKETQDMMKVERGKQLPLTYDP